MLLCLLALTLATEGCVVATSRFDAKVRESDALRDALASVNREKGAQEARNEALARQVAGEKDASERCAARTAAQEEELRKLRAEFTETSRNIEGTRITRETFITELLEKEKGSGKRIQELSARALACESERETVLRESASMKQKIEELANKAAETPALIALRLERDILLGRVERLSEEKRLSEKRRTERLEALVREIAAISPEVTASSAGPALRLLVPGKVLLGKGKTALSDVGKELIGRIGKAASEFPGASVIVATDGRPAADEILALLAREGNIPGGRILVDPGGREKGATELLLVAP
ncbi:MAG TPA: hypothetical protein DD658_09115 [Deltaproteobacteria bacterium]|nr:hypothetical protein [Deltaproteobacteria bacterium]